MPGETPFDGYNRSHISNQAAYARKIDRLYREVIREVALYAISLKAVFKGNKPLSFTDYPSINRKVDNLVKGLYDGLMLVVVNGIRSEYTLANNRCNELCRMVYGDKNGKLTKEQERKYYKNGDKAAEAFAKRKDNGMGLSDRVWKLVEPYKSELEAGVDIGLRRGRSADELSRDLRSYLKDPHKLFRRVRDEHGQLQLSKNAKAYHPGRGVYRSSYRNARRLTATETNMAYRTAEYERWQKMEFVVGIRIETSQTNHPVADICDTLAGDYPKNFKWVGWHPHCRCIQTPIIRKSGLLADEGETVQEEKAVETLPPQFEKWMDDNGERIARAKSVPYFLKDNPKYTGVAAPRHGAGSRYSGTKLGRSATKEAFKEYENGKPTKLTKEQQTQIAAIASEMGLKDYDPKTFLEADRGMANVNFGNGELYENNCQCCVAVHEARLRGLNLTAVGYNTDTSSIQWQLGEHFEDIWINPKTGKTPQVTRLKAENNDLLLSKLDKSMSAAGRYHIGINFAEDKGHVITAERLQSGKVLFYDPQNGAFLNIEEYTNVESLEVLKVNKLLFAKDVIKAISKVI